MRRTTEKKQTLEDICNSINRIVSDDEYLCKISLNILNSIINGFKDKNDQQNNILNENSLLFNNYLKNNNLLNDIFGFSEEQVLTSSKSETNLSESLSKCLVYIQRHAEKKLKFPH